MKKTVKRALALVLCCVMLFGAAPLNGLAALDFSRLDISLPSFRLPDFNLFGTKASADEDEPAYSGYCGTDPYFSAAWRYYDETKTLYIEGYNMADYSPENPAPWNELNLNEVVENIDFSNYSGRIGQYAFYDFTALTELFIPSTVGELGMYSFGRSFDAGDDSNFEMVFSTDTVYNSAQIQPVYYLDVSIKMQGLKKVFFEGSPNIDVTSFQNCFCLEEVYYAGENAAYGWQDDPFLTLKSRYKDRCINYLNRNIPIANASTINQCISTIEWVQTILGTDFSATINQLKHNSIYSFDSKYYAPRYPNTTFTNNGNVENEILSVCYNSFILPTENGYYALRTEDHVLYINGSGVCGDGEQPLIDNYYGALNYNPNDIYTISFSDDITAIADNAFCNLYKIKYLKSPGGVQSIGENAFGTSNSITNYVDTTTHIVYRGYYLDYYINEEDSKPAVSWLIRTDPEKRDCFVKPTTAIIAGGALKDSGLEMVYIPESVKYIGKNALKDCDNFICAVYSGDENSWNQIVIEPEGNEALARVSFGEIMYWDFGDGINARTYSIGNECVLEISSYGYGVINSVPAEFEEEKSRITKLVIEEDIYGIADGVFKGFTNVEDIDLPLSLYTLGSDVFTDTKVYSDWANESSNPLVIDNCLIRVGSDATSVNIGRDIICIADDAFSGCTGFESITVNADNGRYSSAGNVLVDKYRGNLILGSDTAVIPDDIRIRTISASAFKGCTQLESVTVPEGVTTIGESAFEGCTSLADITLPESVEYIGVNAFANTAYKNNPDNWTVSPFGFRELYINKNLLAVTRGDSEKNFYIIDEYVRCVDSGAFAELTGCEEIYIMSRNTFLPDDVFYGWQGAQVIYYFGTNAEWNDTHGSVELNGTPLFCVYDMSTPFFAASGTGNVTIEGLTSTGKALKVVRIPEELEINEGLGSKPVTGIREEAFQNETGIEALYIPKNIADPYYNRITIGTAAFKGCSGISYLYIDTYTDSQSDSFKFAKTPLTTPEITLVFGENATEIKYRIFGNNALFSASCTVKKLIILSEHTMNSISEYGVQTSNNPLRNIKTAGPLGGGYDFEFGWKEIPYNAFSSCINLTSVTIPGSVIYISGDAFSGCTGLKTAGPIGGNYNIKFGWTESVPANAFSGCKALTSVTIPDSVTYIGSYAFSGCTGLTSVTIPGAVTGIGNAAFRGCTNLTSITIPGSVTDIGGYAFSGCKKLTEITIPDGVKSIGDFAFEGCGSSWPFVFGIETIDIPGSVTSIGVGVFSGCTRLTSITVSPGNSVYHSANNCIIRTADKTLVAGCKSSIIPGDGSVTAIADCAFYNCSGLKAVNIPKRVTTIGKNAFYKCSGIETIDIPDSVATIGNNAFYCVSNIRYNENMTAEGSPWGAKAVDAYIEGNLIYENSDKLLLLACSPDASGTVTVPASVVEVGDNCFSNCDNVTSIVFQSESITFSETMLADNTSVTSISSVNTDANGVTYTKGIPASGGAKAPRRATAGDVEQTAGNNGILRCNTDSTGTYTVPDTISCICENAFYNCENVTVVIPDTVTLHSIGKNAFYNSKNYKNWKSEDSEDSEVNFIIGNFFIEGYPDLSEFIIPENIICIADGAFEFCKVITKIIIESSSQLRFIGKYAFRGCDKLVEVQIPDGVESIGIDAFAESGIANAESPVILNGCLVSVPKNITEYEIGADITCIAQGAFKGCAGLTSVTILSDAAIPDDAFSECINLRTVTFEGNVTKIGNNAFRDCISLKQITIPASVTEIGDFVFYHCVSLESITVDTGNKNYKSVDGVLFDKGGTKLIQFPAAKPLTPVDGKKTYSVDSGVTLIGQYSFDHCQAAEIIEIGNEDVKYGLRNPFQFCSALFNFGGETTDTLYQDKDKTEIANVTVTGENGGVYTVPDGVTKIGDGAFAGNTNLTGIDWGSSSVTEIGDEAFLGCTGLTSITIPDTVQKIGERAFENCTSLETVVFAPEGKRNDTLISVGDRAFCDCGLDYENTYNIDNLTSEENGPLYRNGTADHPVIAFGNYVFHAHSGWIIEKEATCKEAGLKKPDCACGITDSVVIPRSSVHTPAEAVEENTVAATCTAGGSYESVVYCSVCGVEISRNTVETDPDPLNHDLIHHDGKASTCTAKGYKDYDTCSRCDYTTYEELPLGDHTPAEPVVENETFSTCKEAGTYDLVVYCSNPDCKVELSRETKIKEKDAHVPGNPVTENEVPATCTEGGSYESVVYCSACEDELSRETVETNPLGHKIIHHDGNASTCKVKGYKDYDTCSRCDYTTYEELPLADHTPAGAVKENVLASTCKAAGHYDSVVYCSVCEDELSRETVKTDPLGHSFTKYTYNNDATFASDGTETAKCDRCDETDTKTVKGTKFALPAIKARETAQVEYRAKITVTATATGVPDRYVLAIYEGNTLRAKGTNTSVSYTPKDGGNALEMKSDTVFTVKVIDAKNNVQKDANGNDLTANIEVKVKQGFFDKLIAFFKGLFGLLPMVAIEP